MKLHQIIFVSDIQKIRLTDTAGNDCKVLGAWCDNGYIARLQHIDTGFDGYNLTAVSEAEVVEVVAENSTLIITIAYDLSAE